MKVTVIGAGHMGSAFVKQLTRAGHQAAVTARDSNKAAQLAAAHHGAVAVPVTGAAADADAVILATGYGDAPAALQAVGGLKNARYLEPLAGLNIYLGYGAGLGTNIAPTWIRKA